MSYSTNTVNFGVQAHTTDLVVIAQPKRKSSFLL